MNDNKKYSNKINIFIQLSPPPYAEILIFYSNFYDTYFYNLHSCLLIEN